MAVPLAVTGDVFDGVLFYAVIFPRGVLDEIWNRIESVPNNFPIYSFRHISEHSVVLDRLHTFCSEHSVAEDRLQICCLLTILLLKAGFC